MKKIIAIDLETDEFSRGNMAPKIVCMSVASERETHLIVGDDDIKEFLSILLKQPPDITIVGQVIAYDFACILANYHELWDLVFRAYDLNGVLCTCQREKLLDIELGEFRVRVEEFEDDEEEGLRKVKHDYHLGELSELRLGRKLNKETLWRTRFGELRNIPVEQWPQEAVSYSIEDARATYDLFVEQEERARKRNYSMPTQYDDTRADFALKLMSVWGICTDRNRVEHVLGEAQIKKHELGLWLENEGLVTITRAPKIGDLFGPAIEKPDVLKRNLKVIKELVVKHYPGEAPRTAKGNVQTGAEVLEECIFKPFEWLVDYMKIEKTISTYLLKLLESPIHAYFKSIGAVSDRTSCSDPNLQNNPRLPGVRECFKPRAGFAYLACDYSAQEMRTFAQSCLDLFGYSRLAEMFNSNLDFDPHLELALSLSRGDLARAQGLRYRAKTANFGFAGGMGDEKFIGYAKNSGVILTREESKELKTAWLNQWPEARKFFKHVGDLVGFGGMITMTQPRSGFRRANCKFTDACNSYFQTLAAHASKEGLWQVTKRCYVDQDSALYGSRPVLFIHDDVTTETPIYAVHEAAIEINRVMCDAMRKWVPDVPAKAETVAMMIWSKKAKSTFENGRLVPWREETK